MRRSYLKYLLDWLARKDRKPLVIRGARQVGKTWIVRELARVTGRTLIEINFERRREFERLFVSNNPQQVMKQVMAALNLKADFNDCLLFLDEIQAVPSLLAKLRWFAEELPQLAVIAAGSLLEFVLDDHDFSMPVGRISYLHMEPLSFEEFLKALGKEGLLDYLHTFLFSEEIPKVLHDQLLLHFKEYLLVGGLPAAVNGWADKQSMVEVSDIQQSLIATYRDDFTKYSGRLSIDRLEEVMLSTPRLLSHSFKFSRVNSEVNYKSIKQAFNLLRKARLCHRIESVYGNGVPLGAEIDNKRFKAIFLDVGLCSSMLGLLYNDVISIDEINLINKGGIAEQVVGQLLRTISPPYVEPRLYYWQRDKPGSKAELDYLIQYAGQVVPVEVKAGSTGTLKSLHYFMGVKKLSLAVRINSDYPSITPVRVKNHEGNVIEYTLLSTPFYMIGELTRLIAGA